MSKSIFDHAKSISTTKPSWESLSEEDQKSWNTYMVNRILSMNPDLIELVDYIQLNSNLPPEIVYKTYCALLPKGYAYKPFVKAQIKSANIKAVADYFQVSKREAREYAKLLDADALIDILQEFEEEPYETKKIKKSKNGTA